MTTNAPTLASDADLLRRYAAGRDEDAFAALADRYLPLIYSAALRQARDPHVAEDVAQATLVVLSQKAGAIDPALLPGWLLKTTHYAARNALRQRARRIAHEQRAAAMKSEQHAPPPDPDAVARVIDPALARLRDADRTAVVLRYFQNKSFAEVAAHLQTTEAAAQRRIARAVDKLRAILARQGVTVAPAALPAVLAAQALHPVPPSLALHATSLAGSKAGSTLLIAKGALHAMAAAKVKAAAAIAAAVLLVGAAVPTAYHYATARPEPAVPAPVALPAGTDLSRPATGSLPPGMTVEPVAAMSASDKRWITPTGRELATVPVDVDELLTRVSVPNATHAFLFRLTPPAGDVSWTYSLREANSYASIATTDARTGDRYVFILLAPRSNAASLTLTVDAATGPWTTCAVVPATATTPTRGTLAGRPLSFDPPTQAKGMVRLQQTGTDRAPGQYASFYAITAAGKKAAHTFMTSDRQGNPVYGFPGTLSAYKEFRLDARPYNYHATYAPVPLTR